MRCMGYLCIHRRRSMLIVLPRFCFTETLKYVSCRKCFSHKNWKTSCVQWEESQGDKWANRKQTPSSSSTSLMRPVFSFSMDGKVYVCLHLCVCVCTRLSECMNVYFVTEAVKSSLKSPNRSKLACGTMPPHNYIHPHCSACIPGVCVCVRLHVCVFGQWQHFLFALIGREPRPLWSD